MTDLSSLIGAAAQSDDSLTRDLADQCRMLEAERDRLRAGMKKWLAR